MQRPAIRFTTQGMRVTACILILASFATTRGSDQPLALSVQGQEVIRLAEQPKNGRVYDVAFAPGAIPLSAHSRWNGACSSGTCPRSPASSPLWCRFCLQTAGGEV